MTVRPLRVGIIGTGFGTLVHAPGFRSEGWEVVALCSRNRERVRKAADEAGVAEIHTDPLEMIGRGDLDAVSISSPPATHHPLVIAALKAGKHVLCEKPFALDTAQAIAMRDAAAASGRTAMVAHEFRRAPQRARIRELLDQGFIGRFRLCTIELSVDRYVGLEPRALTWNARNAEGGGLLGALGSHYIDGLRHWFGEVATASGWLDAWRPDVRDPATGAMVRGETDDTYGFTLAFRNGGCATMTASFAATPARGVRIAVMGDAGTLVATQPGPNPLEDGTLTGGRDGAPMAELPMPRELAPFTDARDHRLMAFRLLVRDFSDGIARGVSPAPNFADGWRCQQVLDAIRESARTGRTVAIG